MKRLLISISILLIVSFSLNLILIFAGSKEKKSQAAAEPVAIRAEDVRLEKRRRELERLKQMDVIGSRINLERAAQERNKAELNFLRELAVEEGAVRTTEVIDRLLAGRDKRLEQTVRKMEERASREQGRRGSDRELKRQELEEGMEKELPNREDEKTQEDVTGD